jgi:hypothetical protein
MKSVVISKQALSELVKEALDNHDYGVSHSTAVNVNPNADPSAIETDPFNKDVEPRNGEELKKSLVLMANDIGEVPDEKVNKAYNDIKDAIDTATSTNDKVEEARKLTEGKGSFGSRIVKLVREGDLPGVDDVSKNKEGNVVLRRGFFYKQGMRADDFANKIAKELTALGINFQVVNKGEVNKPFVGGGGTRKNSHWWVEIKEDVPAEVTITNEPVWPGSNMKTEEAIRNEIRKVLIETSEDPAVEAWKKNLDAHDAMWPKKKEEEPEAEETTGEKEEVAQETQAEKQESLQSKKPEATVGTGEVKEATEEDDEDEDDEEKRFKSNKEGASFKDIAKDLGFSVAGAKASVDRALAKASYVASMDPDDLRLITLYAIREYIDILSSSGELSPEDIQFLLNNPNEIELLDGFREYLGKAIKREMALDRVNVEDEQED